MNNAVAELPFVAHIGVLPGCACGSPAKPREASAMPANGPSQRVHIGSTRAADGDALPVLTTSASCEALLLANLHVVDGVIRFVCQRQRVSATEAEEFASEVKLRLVDNDYDVLRRFQQRSSLRTYLSVVIQRMFLDYRNRLWGKWRPSAEALRLGPVAVRLERLIVREGYGFDQAYEVLRINEGVTLGQSELADIAARLPSRTRPTLVGEELLESVPGHDDLPDAELGSENARANSLRIRRALAPAMRELADQDRLILRLRFQDGLAVADIARALNLDQKPLYRRLEALLRRLREALEAQGIDGPTVLDVISRKDVDISLALLDAAPVAAAPGVARPPTDI